MNTIVNEMIPSYISTPYIVKFVKFQKLKKILIKNAIFMYLYTNEYSNIH